MRNNDDFMDAIAIVSFLVGLANYQENLTQTDKDEMMQRLDTRMNAVLDRLEKDLEEQNKMLTEIIDKIKEIKESEIHKSEK